MVNRQNVGCVPRTNNKSEALANAIPHALDILHVSNKFSTAKAVKRVQDDVLDNRVRGNVHGDASPQNTFHFSPFTFHTSRFTYPRQGFSLAEVLVTLGIIGVVASLTIPTLMNKAKYTELAGQFKKEYSTLSNAWSQIITENGGSVVGSYSSGDIALDAICTKVKCIKKCYAAVGNSADCLVAQSEIKPLDGVTDSSWLPMEGSIGVLADGSTFWLKDWTPACNFARNNNTTCSYLEFDINGKKKPNTIGRDIFELWLTQTKVIPTGAIGTGISPDIWCNPAVTTYQYNGASCGAKILLEGAMNY